MIERTSSPYNSPILCVAKPDSKETRFLLDCRAINERIVTNYNYIHDAKHVIQIILQCRAKYFSKFDLKSAFFSLNLDPESRHVTAFSHPNLGQFFLSVSSGNKIKLLSFLPGYESNFFRNVGFSSYLFGRHVVMRSK